VTQIEAADPDTGTQPRRHVHLAQVRYADLDPQHHVNNVRMLTYLEDARISFLRYGGAVEAGEEVFGATVVAHQEADYLAPLLPRSTPVRVESWVTEVRNASFTLAYEIRDDTTVFLRAKTVLVGFNVDTQSARRLNEKERALLAAFA
jgi:acyl-CoA thioester hydrolase